MKTKTLYIAIAFITLTIVTALGIVLQTRKNFNTLPKPTLSIPLPTQRASINNDNNIPAEYQGKLHLFILAGQSNMSGRGELPNPAPTPNPAIYVFGNDYQWRVAADPVDDPHNQVDKVSEDENAAFSPALPFAQELLNQRSEMLIALIPCALDDTTIQDWQRNPSDQSLYGSCLKRARTASIMGTISGILFFQGESDALDPKKYPGVIFSPNQWADKFSVFVTDWRHDLGLTELPVVFAQIGTNTRPNRYPNWRIVQEQQSSVRLPFCKMITTDDLALGDTVHFTTESYQIIGKRFAKAYLEILQGK
jgi:hypothetical protein